MYRALVLFIAKHEDRKYKREKLILSYCGVTYKILRFKFDVAREGQPLLVGTTHPLNKLKLGLFVSTDIVPFMPAVHVSAHLRDGDCELIVNYCCEL